MNCKRRGRVVPSFYLGLVNTLIRGCCGETRTPRSRIPKPRLYFSVNGRHLDAHRSEKSTAAALSRARDRVRPLRRATRSARHDQPWPAVASVLARGLHRHGVARRCDPRGLECMGQDRYRATGPLRGVPFDGAWGECGRPRFLVASVDSETGGAIHAEGVSDWQRPLGSGSGGGKAALR